MVRHSLHVVVGSTRPGRIGPAIASWFVDVARGHDEFDVTLVDLLDLDLPLLDEPGHPRNGRYTHPHTQRWSNSVTSADALVFVVPEYNHSFNAATKNAIDFLHAEWRYKPIGFVSYGGVAAGTRAVQALKPVFTSVKAFPLFESVNIPRVDSAIDNGRYHATAYVAAAAHTMLDELLKVSRVLRPLRSPNDHPNLP